MKKTAWSISSLVLIITVAIYSLSCGKKTPENNAVTFIKIQGSGEPTDIAVDKKGNMYVLGVYKGTSTFGNTEKNTNGSLELFLVKYDSSGIMQWFQTAGVSDLVPKPENAEANITSGARIVLDSSGNIYITGQFDQFARFGTITKTADTFRTKTFIAKYNNKGQVQWVEEVSSTGINLPKGLALDKNNNIYLTGTFTGTLLTGKTPTNAIKEFDNFIAKYTADGKLQWVQSVRDKDNNEVLTYDLASDNDGNVYVTGNINPIIGFVDYSLNKPFTAKYNTNGELQWMSIAETTQSGDGQKVLVDNNNNVYMKGFYTDSIKFGDTTLVKGTDTTMNHFLTKFNSQGNLLWVRSIYGKGLTTERMALDKDNHVYVAGYFYKKMFKADVFINKYNSEGNLQWVKTTDGSDNNVNRSITIGEKNMIYTTGYFNGKAVFDSQNEISAGNEQTFIYIWRFRQ